jgi:predicted transglutaminase-like cysteine proteinase
MTATFEQLSCLEAVNDTVNDVPYVADNPIFAEAPDTWKFRPDGKSFVCRDYTLAKAHELIAGGWPKLDLSEVLCYTEPVDGFPDGEYHAVLAAEASGETWILDNRASAIYRWDEPPFPYRWALRQVAGTDEFLDISAA